MIMAKLNESFLIKVKPEECLIISKGLDGYYKITTAYAEKDSILNGAITFGKGIDSYTPFCHKERPSFFLAKDKEANNAEK